VHVFRPYTHNARPEWTVVKPNVRLSWPTSYFTAAGAICIPLHLLRAYAFVVTGNSPVYLDKYVFKHPTSLLIYILIVLRNTALWRDQENEHQTELETGCPLFTWPHRDYIPETRIWRKLNSLGFITLTNNKQSVWATTRPKRDTLTENKFKSEISYNIYNEIV
jgi:hypothetical protein